MNPTRVIVISGGSRGLGAAMVRHFLDRGDSVAAFSRKPANWLVNSPLSPEASQRLFYAAVDAADSQALYQFVRQTHERFGRIDCLINNAAVAYDGVLALMPERDLEQMLNINVRAALLLCKECARLMLLQSSGAIVNISSIVGLRGFSGLSVYAATKAALLGMTRALARELGPKNIRVNALAPGYLETEMSQALSQQQRQQIIRRTPLGRLGRIEDIIPCLDFLLSPGAAFITGQTFTVDGGASC